MAYEGAANATNAYYIAFTGSWKLFNPLCQEPETSIFPSLWFGYHCYIPCNRGAQRAGMWEHVPKYTRGTGRHIIQETS